MTLKKIILNLKAISFACISAAQGEGNPIVMLDQEAQTAIEEATKILETRIDRKIK
jgi:hypothetical protein